jgi:hypothetical protein
MCFFKSKATLPPVEYLEDIRAGIKKKVRQKIKSKLCFFIKKKWAAGRSYAPG